MRKLPRSAVLLFLICAVTAPLPASDNVATLRFESLDAVLADAERISAMSGEPKSREELTRDMFGSVGIGDGAWIDDSSPIVISLPADGLMNMGWVGALPVQAVDDALAALEARLGAPEVDGELHAFAIPAGTTIQVRAEDGYLVFGQQPTAVRGADLKQLLRVGSVPPGNVSLDIDLVPLTAMAQFGMAAGRQGVEDSLELDESDTVGREAAMSMYDFYVGVANDTLLNASRIQFSFELGSESLRFHEWLLPRSGSTFEGLLKAQKSGFPEVARRMDVESAVAIVASNFVLTDEFRTALKEFAAGYAETMESMGSGMPEEDADWFLAVMGPWTKLSDRWVDCTRGDTAAAYDFGAETGFHVTQVAGLTQAEGCSDLIADLGEAMAGISASPEGEPLAVIQEQALQHAGVSATRMEMKLFPEEIGADADEAELMQRMFGGDSYVSYMGMKNDLLVSTSGAGAEQSFKDAVDRLSTKKKKGGMTAKHFEPLKVGSGIFFALDMERILHEIAKLDSEDEDLMKLEAVAEQAGRWVFGFHLNPDALRIEVALPLSALEVLAALDDEDDEDDDSQHEEEESGKEAGHATGAEHS